MSAAVVFTIWLYQFVHEARLRATVSGLTFVERALDAYKGDNGVYPTMDQWLSALVAPPSRPPIPEHYQGGGYLKDARALVDTWGDQFQYQVPGTHNPRGFDVWSLGPSGKPGGTGWNSEIGNWSGAD
jgi:general secretion pathway protein G